MRAVTAGAGGVEGTARLARRAQVGRPARSERSAERVRVLGAEAVVAVLVYISALGKDLWSVSMGDDWAGCGNRCDARAGIS